jgi:hypothetical protein
MASQSGLGNHRVHVWRAEAIVLTLVVVASAIAYSPRSAEATPVPLSPEIGLASALAPAQQTTASGQTVSYSEGGLQPLVPSRVLDTRTGNGAPAAKVAAGGIIDLQATGRGGVPSTGVGAVVLNVTAVDATAQSYVTVWPTGAAQPDASNLNVVAGDTIPNLVIAKVGTGGRVSLFNFAGEIHLLADVVGWFPDGASGSTAMTLKSGTVLAGAGDVVATSGSPATGGTVVLAASADVPAVGGHLAVMPNPIIPGGFAGQVTMVATNGDGTTTVTLVPANLQDMYVNVVIHGTIAPTGAGVSNAAALVAPSPHALVAQAASCSGSLSTVPSVSFGGYGGTFDFDLLGGTARAVVTAEASITWGITASVSVGCEISTPKVVVAVVGPVTFEVGLVAQVSVSASVNASYTTTVPIKVGFDYDNGDVTNLSGADIAGTASSPNDQQASISASVLAGASMDVLLGGVVGFNITIGPRATLTISGTCVELVGDLSIQISTVVGRWGIDWTVQLADISLLAKTLYRDGCGGKVWVGDIHVTESGMLNGYATWSETLTYNLRPDDSIDADGSGEYRAVINGSGSYDAHTACEYGGQSTYDMDWTLTNQYPNEPLIMFLAIGDDTWQYFPIVRSINDLATGTAVSHDCYGGTSTGPVAWDLGYNPYANDVNLRTLSDTNPAADRLVGTTTWNDDDGQDWWSQTYTVTYDLTLIDRDAS